MWTHFVRWIFVVHFTLLLLLYSKHTQIFFVNSFVHCCCTFGFNNAGYGLFNNNNNNTYVCWMYGQYSNNNIIATVKEYNNSIGIGRYSLAVYASKEDTSDVSLFFKNTAFGILLNGIYSDVFCISAVSTNRVFRYFHPKDSNKPNGIFNQTRSTNTKVVPLYLYNV